MSTNNRDWATTKALLQHFEDEWVAGNNPDPAEYLSRVPEQDRAALAAAIAQLRAEGLPVHALDSPVERKLLVDSVMALPAVFIMAFLALLAVAPNIWAASVAAAFILVSGQMFTRVVLSMPPSRRQRCFSLAAGSGLLGFFWIVFQVMK